MTITIDQMVRREVIVPVSTIVGALANNQEFNRHTSDIAELSEEAMQLCMPLLDYEEAAIQAGWKKEDDGAWTRPMISTDVDEAPVADDAEDACNVDRLDPLEHEIYEHWAVSDWLAARLSEVGERVGPFGDLTVWGRTCSGQGIACDLVIQQIFAGMHDSNE